MYLEDVWKCLLTTSISMYARNMWACYFEFWYKVVQSEAKITLLNVYNAWVILNGRFLQNVFNIIKNLNALY